MFSSLIVSVVVLGCTLQFGVSLGELSVRYVATIAVLWIAAFAASLAMGWPIAVVIVATIVFAIVSLMLSYGGDLRIR